MRIKSKALWQYLKDRELHEAAPDDPAVQSAKTQYRKDYKRDWKKSRVPKKEMRIEFTLAQHVDIRLRATELHSKPTAYCRKLILAAVESLPVIHNREQLEKVFQLLGMSLTPLIRYEAHQININELKEYLQQAEGLLSQYLKQD